jgi:lauroyl/myristoyl acyltransferase
MEKNLDEVFPNSLTPKQKENIVKSSFREFWQDTLQLLPLAQNVTDLGPVEFQGKEHLEEAVSRGNGVILWESNGLGRRFASKRILLEHGFKITQIHGSAHLGGFLEYSTPTWVRRSWIIPFFENAEKKLVPKIINIPDSNSLAFTRTLLDEVKQNAILCVAGDGRTGQKLISLPFLGHPTLFSTGMISLAKSNRATILPMFCLTEADRTVRLIVEGPIQTEMEEARETILEKSVFQYANILEKYIRKYPEQYRNWHLL